ncbi:MAG: helix-turn-helix domain-containing protein [Lactococcus lactis]
MYENLKSMILKINTNHVTESEESVLLSMLRFAKDNDGRIFPSLNELSKDSKLSKPCVIQAIKKLLSRGILLKSERKSNLSNEYFFNSSYIEQINKSKLKNSWNIRHKDNRRTVIYKNQESNI